jgi:hypothetical protein
MYVSTVRRYGVYCSGHSFVWQRLDGNFVDWMARLKCYHTWVTWGLGVPLASEALGYLVPAPVHLYVPVPVVCARHVHYTIDCESTV